MSFGDFPQGWFSYLQPQEYLQPQASYQFQQPFVSPPQWPHEQRWNNEHLLLLQQHHWPQCYKQSWSAMLGNNFANYGVTPAAYSQAPFPFPG